MQGESYWRSLVAADDETFRSAVMLMADVRDPGHPRRWDTPHGSENVFFVVQDVYEARFGNGTFHGAFDAFVEGRPVAPPRT